MGESGKIQRSDLGLPKGRTSVFASEYGILERYDYTTNPFGNPRGHEGA